MALLEKLQANLAAAPTTPGIADNTKRTASLLAARSGKAVGSPAPMSNIAEQVAAGETAQQAQQLQAQGQMAAAQLGQQAAQVAETERSERADLGLQQQQVMQRASQQKQSILRELGEGRRKLDLDRDRAALEQLSHTMALSDRKYVDELQLAGQRGRLDNELQFREALQKSVFGSNLELLKQGLANTDILQADQREFEELMANIDLDAALQIAQNEISDAKKAAQIAGIGSLVTAGIGMYGQQQSGAFDGEYQAYRDETDRPQSYSKWRANQAPTDVRDTAPASRNINRDY